MALSQVTLSQDIYQAFIFRTLFEKSKRCKDSLGSPCHFLLRRDLIGAHSGWSQTTVFATDEGVVYWMGFQRLRASGTVSFA